MKDFIKNLCDKITEPFIWININFIRPFKRSSKWFVRMWNNYDWDGEYIIEMLVWKMKDMRYRFDHIDIKYVDLRHQPKEFSSNCDEYEDRLEGLDRAIELGERILKNDYVEYTPEVQKWFDEHDIFGKDKMSDDIHKQWMESHKRADKKEKNDKDIFFKIIRRDFESWWT